MRVGSDGVGGVPHDAEGGRSATTRTSADAAARGPGGGFIQLLALLKGAVAEPKAGEVGEGEDADDSAREGDGAATDDGASPQAAQAAAAAHAAADVVVTLSRGCTASAGRAAAQRASAKQAVDPKLVGAGATEVSSDGTGTGAPVTRLARANGDPVACAGRAASAPGASLATTLHDARVPEAGADGVGTTTAGPPAQHARVGSQGRAAVPQEMPAVACAARPGPASPSATEPPPASGTVLARQVLRSFADAADGGHANEREGRGAADSPETIEPAPVQGAGRSAALSVAHGRDEGPVPAVGGDHAADGRELNGATRAPGDASGVAKPLPEVPRASIASGAASGLPSWIERVASAQRLAAGRNAEALLFDLEPNGLGRIEVRLSVGRDGVRTQIFTEHEQTRTLLANQQSQLAAVLERNELRLESFVVDLGLGGEAGHDARHQPTDVEAFDQTGLVSSSAADDLAGEALPVAGLVSVRA
jgi:hypothetical protein